jgi:phage-related minor tail protein
MSNVGEVQARISLGGMDVVERQLKRFSQSMNNIAKQASEMGNRLREAGESFNEIGENIAPLSAGLLAVGSASVVASDNINQGLATFQTKLGATGADLERYRGVMEQVAKTGVGSFEEVSNAVITVAQNMKGLSDSELTMVSEEAMQLANVMGTDVGEVTKVAGQLMKQFGVNGATAMDLIAKGYQNGMDYAGDYMDTINEYSVYFKSLGFSAEDMFNILISGAKAGAFNLDKVGDAVKEFNIRAKDGSETTKEAFKALGFDAEKMSQTFAKGGEGAKQAYAQVVQALAQVDDQAKRNQLGVALFGTQYEDMEKDVIASTGRMVDHMKNVEGASAEIAQNNRSFAQEMQGAWNKIQIAIKPVGDAIRGAILDVMPYVVSAIQGLSNAFSSLSPTMQKVVLGFGAFIAFLPVLIIGLGSMASVAGVFMNGISVLAKGFSLLSGGVLKLIGVFKTVIQWIGIISRVFMANPFMLIVAGIIVVAVLIYKYWDEIKAYTVSVWNSIKAWFAPYWESFKTMVSNVVTALKSKWESFKAGFMALWNGIKSFLSATWNVIKTIILIAVGVIVTIFAPIYNAFASVWNKAVSVAQSVWNKIKAGASALWSAIKSGLDKVKSFFASVWNAIYSNVIIPVISKIKSIVNTLISAIKAVVDKVKSVFSSAWNAIYSSVVSPVVNKIKSIVQTLSSTASSVGNKVKSVFSSAWNGIKSLVGSAIESIKSKISGIWDKASSIASRIKSAFSGLFKGIKVPRFSLGGWTPKDLPRLPKISVSWHAKGGILDSATLIGAGEKGAEAIVPLSSQRRMRPFAQAVAKFMPEGSRSTGNTSIHVAQLVVREEADIERIAQRLNQLQERKERARGGLSFNG